MDDDDVEPVQHAARVFENLLDFILYGWGWFRRSMRGLTVEQIVEMAEDGDVLEFNGRGLVPWIQRTFTAGEVSHVAVVCHGYNRAGEWVKGYAEADRHKPPANELDVAPTCAIHFVPLELGIRTYLKHDGLEVSLRKLQLYVENPVGWRERVNAAVQTVMQRYAGQNTPFTTDLTVFVGVAYPWLAAVMATVRDITIAHTGSNAFNEVAKYHSERGIYCSRFVTECFVEAGLFTVPPGAHHAIAPVHFTESFDPALTPMKRARAAGKPRNSALPWALPDARVFGLGPTQFVR